VKTPNKDAPTRNPRFSSNMDLQADQKIEILLKINQVMNQAMVRER